MTGFKGKILHAPYWRKSRDVQQMIPTRSADIRLVFGVIKLQLHHVASAYLYNLIISLGAAGHIFAAFLLELISDILDDDG